MSEQDIASGLRNLVQKVYSRVDDADVAVGTVFVNTGMILSGALEAAKQVLVEVDKALAEYDKTEEVKLGADLAEANKHDYEVESESGTRLTTTEKLAEINNAADAQFGPDGHVWWLVEVTDQNRDAIDEAYNKLVAGTLWE